MARDELAGPRRHAADRTVMIVLTDGGANPVPVSQAEVEARAAKDAGVVLFTIGLGDDLDADALVAMASRPEFAYRAPDAADGGVRSFALPISGERRMGVGWSWEISLDTSWEISLDTGEKPW